MNPSSSYKGDQATTLSYKTLVKCLIVLWRYNTASAGIHLGSKLDSTKKFPQERKKEKSLHNSLTYPNLNMLLGLPKSTELQECLTTLKRVRNVHNVLSGSSYAIDPRRSCHPSTSSSRIQRFQTESNVVIWRLLGGCLVPQLKQQFLVFKQHYTYFYTLFH